MILFIVSDAAFFVGLFYAYSWAQWFGCANRLQSPSASFADTRHQEAQATHRSNWVDPNESFCDVLLKGLKNCRDVSAECLRTCLELFNLTGHLSAVEPQGESVSTWGRATHQPMYGLLPLEP